MTGDLGSKKKKRVGVGKAIRDRIHARDSFACQKCGRMTNLNIHHILAVQDGGEDDDDNLITLCFPCHREWELAEMIMDIPFEEWLPLPSYDVLLMSVLTQGNMLERGEDEIISIGEAYSAIMQCHILKACQRMGRQENAVKMFAKSIDVDSKAG